VTVAPSVQRAVAVEELANAMERVYVKPTGWEMLPTAAFILREQIV
jgi:hypothetical protein